MSASPWWSGLVPPRVRRSLEGRPLVRAILGNTGWLFADRVVRMGIGLLVGVWVARYLGPERFGTLNYAAAIVGTLAFLASLDLDSVLVRELSIDPAKRGKLLGTAFRLRLAAGALCALGALSAAWALRPGDAAFAAMTLCFSAALLTPAPDIVEAWFRARLEAQWVVAARGAVYLLVAGLRVGLVLAGASTLAFAAAAAAEAILASLALWAVFRWAGWGWQDWAWDSGLAKALLRAAAPLMLSSLAIVAYMKIDQFMLASMAGDAEVGLYSAAVRLSELWYFLPLALAGSAGPALSVVRADPAVFEDRWIKLFKAMLLIALPVAALMSVLAGPLCDLVYGSAFAGTGPILALHVWAGVFVFVGVAQGAAEIARSRTRQMMLRTWCGALLNVALNLLWIPRWQGVGAAAATVISYAVAASGALILSEGGREDLRVQGRMLAALWRMGR